MPRTKKLIKADPRAVETLRQIGGAQSATGKSYRELCRSGGLKYDVFMKHKREIGDMRLRELWAFMDVCQNETM